MSGLRQVWLVARREVWERGRSRAFLVSFAVMLVAVGGAVVLPSLLDADTGPRDVGVTGAMPDELPDAIVEQGDAVDTTIRIHHFDTVEEGEDAVRDGDVDVLVVDGDRIEWLEPQERLVAIATGAIQLVSVRARAADAGIDDADVAALLAPVEVERVELGRVAGRSEDDEAAAFLLTLILFGAITTYGAMVLNGVVEEKSSRTVEVLLARMPARTLLAGKVAGIGALGLAQIVATGAVALIARAVVDSVETPAVRGAVVAWAIVWFLLGYALYATVYGVLGSLASRTEDASSVSGPFTVVLVLGFMASFAVIGSPDATWAQIVSWFPLTAPTAMPNRIAMGGAAWWEPVGATVLSLGAIGGLVVLGGRVYTRAILRTGAAVKLGDAWRDRVSIERPTAVADGGPRRRELALAGAAVVVGVVVFAVSKDVVAGVAVGAGGFALGRRAIRSR